MSETVRPHKSIQPSLCAVVARLRAVVAESEQQLSNCVGGGRLWAPGERIARLFIETFSLPDHLRRLRNIATGVPNLDNRDSFANAIYHGRVRGGDIHVVAKAAETSDNFKRGQLSRGGKEAELLVGRVLAELA